MRFLSSRAARLACVLPVLAAAACGTDSEIPYTERPAEDIYAAAQADFDAGEYQSAAGLYDEVERQHPYSSWATRAQLMSAYSSYQEGDYDQAIISLDRFISLHPGSEDLDYAYYLKALCYYDRISDVERDQRITEQALVALNDVVNRFPASEYARDADLKIDLTYDQLAGQDMSIGRFYLRQQDYNAAINRFRRVITNFQTTSQVPEALYRLIEAYLSLGLEEEARETAAVLGYNYPGSEWYLESYALLVDAGVRPPDDRSIINRTLDSIF